MHNNNRDSASLKRIASYVPQEDSLPGVLSPRPCCAFFFLRAEDILDRTYSVSNIDVTTEWLKIGLVILLCQLGLCVILMKYHAGGR